MDKEADWEQAHLPKDKRSKRPSGKEPVWTSSSEESETDKPPKKKQKKGKATKGVKPKKTDEEED